MRARRQPEGFGAGKPEALARDDKDVELRKSGIWAQEANEVTLGK